MTRQQIDVQVKKGNLFRIWRGVYATTQLDVSGRLTALDVFMGQKAVACMGTAAALHGFDVQDSTTIHVLDPGVRMRPVAGLMVHQRLDAPLAVVKGRLTTAPAWTAVEVARTLRRPRILATLDAALRSGSCTRADIEDAVREQSGRRGIVAVRELLEHADGRAESAMESEARLVMIDYGVAQPELQYEIHDEAGEVWRVDFAWPERRVAAEYESIAWHAGRLEMLRDKERLAKLQELGWTVIPMVVRDVRVYPWRLAERINGHLARAALTS
jgi:hypothetical protein